MFTLIKYDISLYHLEIKYTIIADQIFLLAFVSVILLRYVICSLNCYHDMLLWYYHIKSQSLIFSKKKKSSHEGLTIIHFQRQPSVWWHLATERRAFHNIMPYRLISAIGQKRRLSGWRGRWEGGSGWGRHVNSRTFHFNVWQNSLQIKKKKKYQ